MRIRFKALSPTADEDLSQTRPEGPSARQRASERAPKRPKAAAPIVSKPSEAPSRGRDVTEKIKVSRPPNVIEERAPEPKRKDPRRE